MELLSLLLVLVIIAIVYWGINQLTLPPIVKTVAAVVLAVAAVLAIAGAVGIGPGLHLD